MATSTELSLSPGSFVIITKEPTQDTPVSDLDAYDAGYSFEAYRVERVRRSGAIEATRTQSIEPNSPISERRIFPANFDGFVGDYGEGIRDSLNAIGIDPQPVFDDQGIFYRIEIRRVARLKSRKATDPILQME